jgi:hypothetical protein
MKARSLRTFSVIATFSLIIVAILGATVITAQDRSGDGTYEEGKVSWRYDFPDNSGYYPIIGKDGTVYTCIVEYQYAQNPLVAIDSSGNVKWRYMLTNISYIPVLACDGTIVTVAEQEDNSSTVYAINPDGTLKWKFNTSTDLPYLPCNKNVKCLVETPGDLTVFTVGDMQYYGSPNSTFFVCALDSSGSLAWIKGLEGRLVHLDVSAGPWSGVWVTAPERLCALDGQGRLTCSVDLESMGLNAEDISAWVEPNGIYCHVFINGTKNYFFDDRFWNYDCYQHPLVLAIFPNGTVDWTFDPYEPYGYIKEGYTQILGLSSTGNLLLCTYPGSVVNEGNSTEWLANGSQVISSLGSRILEIHPNGTVRVIMEEPMAQTGQVSDWGWSTILISADKVYLFGSHSIEVRNLNWTMLGKYVDTTDKRIDPMAIGPDGTIYFIYGAQDMGGGTLIVSEGLPMDLSSYERYKIPGADDVTWVTISMMVMLAVASLLYVVASRKLKQQQ